MSRSTSPSLTSRIRKALAMGAPLPHDTITLYRTGPRGRLHEHDTCANRTGLTPIEIPIHGPGSIGTYHDEEFCSRCSTRTEWDRDIWDGWVTLAERLVTVDSDLTDPASPSTVADRHRQLASIRGLLDTDTHPELRTAAHHTITALDAAIAVLLETHDPAIHLIAAAVVTMDATCRRGELPSLDADDDPEHRPSVFPREHTSTYISQAHPALRNLWQTWLETAANTSNLAEATDTALAEAATAIAGTATPWDRVPTQARFAGKDYPNPQAWAAAEWAYVAHLECEQLCAAWTAHVTDRVAGGDVTVAITGYNPAGPCQVSQRVAESVATHPRALNGTTVFTSIPRVLLDYLDTQLERYHGHTRWNRPSIVIVAETASSQDELTVAVGLYDPLSDGKLSDPVAALDMARSVVV